MNYNSGTKEASCIPYAVQYVHLQMVILDFIFFTFFLKFESLQWQLPVHYFLSI